MFQFSGFTSIWLFYSSYCNVKTLGFPIRKSTDRWIFAPPRGLSQLVTSFFGSWCQGIRRMLLLAWPRPENLWFEGHALKSQSSFVTLIFQTISRSPWVSTFLHYVSKSCKVFRYQCVLNTFSYPFSIWKNLYFFLLLLRYSVFKQHKRLSSPGGDEESRTPDPLLARQVLSQLSYTPILIGNHIQDWCGGLKWTRTTDLTLIRRVL